MGIGQGKTTGKGSKGSGSAGGKPTPTNKPTSPRPDEPKVSKSSNGLELILEQNPVVKTKQQIKQITEQVKKNKKKKSQNSGSDYYYLSSEVIRASPNQQSQLASSLPSLRLDFGQSLKQEFSLGQIINPQLKQQTKQETKQLAKQKQNQRPFALVNPFMARGNPTRPTAVIPMQAMPIPFSIPTQQSQQTAMPFMPWFQQEAYRGRRKKGKKGKQGKQGWYVPRVDPLGLTKQFKSGDGTAMNFMYWGTGNKQTKVGYF